MAWRILRASSQSYLFAQVRPLLDRGGACGLRCGCHMQREECLSHERWAASTGCNNGGPSLFRTQV
eukprot:6440288-Prymnesium_polylepis.2